MSNAEKYISDCTRNCSNEYLTESKPDGLGGCISRRKFTPWLSPDQARKAVEIAREETLHEVKSKLLYMLNTSADNKHFFEQLDDYIEELKTSNER